MTWMWKVDCLREEQKRGERAKGEGDKGVEHNWSTLYVCMTVE
jgi:hypothetical protein